MTEENAYKMFYRAICHTQANTQPQAQSFLQVASQQYVSRWKEVLCNSISCAFGAYFLRRHVIHATVLYAALREAA